MWCVEHRVEVAFYGAIRHSITVLGCFSISPHGIRPFSGGERNSQKETARPLSTFGYRIQSGSTSPITELMAGKHRTVRTRTEQRPLVYRRDFVLRDDCCAA